MPLSRTDMKSLTDETSLWMIRFRNDAEIASTTAVMEGERLRVGNHSYRLDRTRYDRGMRILRRSGHGGPEQVVLFQSEEEAEDGLRVFAEHLGERCPDALRARVGLPPIPRLTVPADAWDEDVWLVHTNIEYGRADVVEGSVRRTEQGVDAGTEGTYHSSSIFTTPEGRIEIWGDDQHYLMVCASEEDADRTLGAYVRNGGDQCPVGILRVAVHRGAFDPEELRGSG